MFINKNDFEELLKESKRFTELVEKSSNETVKYAQKCLDWQKEYNILLKNYNVLLREHINILNYVHWIQTGEQAL